MEIKTVVNNYFDLMDELRVVAEKFVDIHTDCPHTVLDIRIMEDREYFSFQYTPCTSGTYSSMKLPLDLAYKDDISSLLEHYSKEEKKRVEEERKKHVCESCGNDNRFGGSMIGFRGW